MDNSQYQNAMSSNNSQYSSLPGISPQQLQQNSGLPAHTLPPLQASQHAPMQQPMYGSAPHTPRTPATPNTPASSNGMNFPGQMGQQPRSYQMMPNTNNYQQPQQGYRTMSNIMPQSSGPMSHPQAIAPAPSQNRLPQTLRPMPPNGLHMQSGMQSPYGQGTMMQLQELEPPTHVVGSQGRRGILPSAPGRPPVSATATGKNALIPAKDADGKFPCPHCTKTYLHAKHLKRHLLRHTGDRPYMCILCRDTFSRSDILKRHFQKCSIRRGNPTGASHLSHSQAHLKKSHPGPHKSSNSMSENGMMDINGMGQAAGGIPVFGVVPDGSVPDAGSNLTEEQAEQLSQSNSMKRLSGGVGRDGGSMAGQGSNRAGFAQNYPGGMASTMPPGMNPPLALMPQGQNGHSYNQGYDYASRGNSTNLQSQSSGGQTWPQTFQTNGPTGYVGQYPQTPQVYIKQEPFPIKSEPSLNTSPNGVFASLYPAANGVDPNTNFPSWNLHNDPLEDISNRLTYLCFPSNQIVGRSSEIRKYLSADNIKHFLDQFTSFQGHFPVIHVPSFRISEAYDGLLLAMICIGAVYSDRLVSTQVREMMELFKSVIERSSQVYSIISNERTGEAGFGGQTIGSGNSELEQITAIFMMQVLFTWHGTPVQREKARREFPLVAEIARRAGLTKPMTIAPFSVLHQPNVNSEHFSAASFDWKAWVEQEKRSRLMFTIFLLDASLVVYFNTAPRFDKHEIRLPLPADDAAWDAPSAAECAEALGLQGPSVALQRNPEGSRRPKQPEMHSALKALAHNTWDLQPGATNLYSKFILIHALHIQLWTAQRQSSLQDASQLGNAGMAFPSSGTSTPISKQDWMRSLDPTGSGPQSANNSGRATPVGSPGQPTQTLSAINGAFEKWKRAWDHDMAEQYPPQQGVRRFGFCRDAVHFYWLGKYLMKQSRAQDWQMAPDQRFSHVINLLKTVKTWVVSDSAQRGETLGSVSEIEGNYGMNDLTLDMAQLFKPINKQIDSPVPGLLTNIGNGTA